MANPVVTLDLHQNPQVPSPAAPTPKRAAQVSPDRFWVGVAAIVLVVIIMLASMVFSYVSIAEAGEWSRVPYGMHWLAPIFIDGAILTYTVSLAIFEARHEDRRTVRRTRGILWGFTALSVAINFAHAGSGWLWNFSAFEAWFGCLIAVAAPIAALLSAEEVVRLSFKHQPAALPEPAEPELPAILDEPRWVSPPAEPQPATRPVTVAEPEPAAELPAESDFDEVYEAEEESAAALGAFEAAEPPAEAEPVPGPVYSETERAVLDDFARSYRDVPSHMPTTIEDLEMPDAGEYLIAPAQTVEDRF